MKPTPRRAGGKWVVDLRAFGHGQNIPLGPDSLPEIEALHLAYAKLLALREAPQVPGAQLQLRAPSSAPKDFATALDEWERRKEYRTPAGERYGRTYSKAVRSELGGYRLADFEPPDGADRLLAYRNGIVASGMAPNTVSNRMSVVRQVLTFARERLWISTVPKMPARPRKRPPLFAWIEEDHFRALRAEVYRGITVAELKKADGVTDEAAKVIFVERRRCYLSWLFYTGVHTADADNCTGEFISLDVGVYRRRNSKSADHVPDEWFALPDPLTDDLRALQRLLGRPFYGDEPVFGGPWVHVARRLARAAKRLKIGAVNPRVLRRSFAREMLKRGYTLHDVADMMGHVDLSMLRQVYVRTPRAPGAGKSRWTRTPYTPRPPAVVVDFPGTRPALSTVPLHANHTEQPEQPNVTTTALTKKEH